jgi:uncharacterized metal-binding protein
MTNVAWRSDPRYPKWFVALLVILAWATMTVAFPGPIMRITAVGAGLFIIAMAIGAVMWIVTDVVVWFLPETKPQPIEWVSKGPDPDAAE